MRVSAAVTVRPFAPCVATVRPARSICESSQPPKRSPCGLASAGIAMARKVGSDCGGRSWVSLADMRVFLSCRDKHCHRSKVQEKEVCSPDGAQRNPGFAPYGKTAPHCASLHAGYVTTSQ